jgi:cupin 2 domain-containing protein
MNEEISIQPGHYRHYKGNDYTVLGTARHSETQEELVVYRQEYGQYGLWVRPKQMFAETVQVGGQQLPRFQPLGAGNRYTSESAKNVYDELPQFLPEEIVSILVRAGNLRIERIISHGHSSPDGFWYDQEQHEWVVVLKGAAKLRFEDETIELRSGDFVNIPAHKKHRLEWTTPDEPTIWLAVFYEHSACSP